MLSSALRIWEKLKQREERGILLGTRLCSRGETQHPASPGSGLPAPGSAQRLPAPRCRYLGFVLWLNRQSQITFSLMTTCIQQQDLLSRSPGWEVHKRMHKSMCELFGGLFNAFCNEQNRDHFFQSANVSASFQPLLRREPSVSLAFH